MPLTKQYLKYVHSASFGVICSRKSSALLLEKGEKGNRKLLAIAPALENVVIWDLKTGDKICILSGDNHEVTSLCKSVTGSGDLVLAAGYEDGSIRIWDLESHDCRVTFSGHKTAVTCLDFDCNSTRLVSGSKDTDIIVWDIVGENGLFRLKGHKGPITCCQFLTNHNVLVTCSKDAVVKLWDLDTQHCFNTIVGHRSEVWGMTLLRDESLLVTGSSDRDMKVHQMSPLVTEEGSVDVSAGVSTNDGPLLCQLLGGIGRKASGRVHTIQSDQYRRHFAVMSGENAVEIYRVRNEEELKVIKKKILKRNKKRAMKLKEAGIGEEIHEELSVTDEVYLYHTFHHKRKIKSCDIIFKPETNEIMLLLTMHCNSLELHSLSSSDPAHSSSDPAHSLYTITHPGHRSDVRTVCVSGDGSLLASGCSELVKVWRRGVCLHTFVSGYAVSSCFIPGDKYLLVGTKTGAINLFEISSGLCLDTFEAHSKAVWSMGVAPDRRGFVSGSADHDVKFWEFELTTDENHEGKRKRLTASHVKTLKMSEDVLCVKYSPDQRLLAVALLDSTVKLFFADTLKFFLSLYGHKLPVLTMDISSDSTLLVTGSADKNIKIWGLDFGDCHRSIFAHDDSVMGVQFVPKTHLIFSVSKDKTLKHWDGDKYDHIQTLKGHHGEVWCLSVSSDGATVVTGSHDLSLRTWDCSQETIVLSEEKENEREAEFEQTIAAGSDPVVPGEGEEGEVGMAGKRTMETMQGAERIMEALEIYREETVKLLEHKEECVASGGKVPTPDPHPILKALGNISPEKYVLSVLKKIKSSDLEKSLFVLPFSDAVDFVKICDLWLQNEWEVELVSRCVCFLLRLHHHQITSSGVLLHVIGSLRQHTTRAIDSVRDVYGFNLAAMNYIQQEFKDRGVSVFKDVSVQVDAVRRRKRKKIEQ